MAIAIGSVVGDYEVIDKLGAGGIGQVYRARHTISHRIEALKILLPVHLATPADNERFVREIRVLASLSHPNIAALHNAFRFEGELVMVMEFVQGVTLRARLAAGPITVGQSLDYIRQALTGLVYAHAQRVIHRDVKPSNIMISPGDRTEQPDRVKLLDFGLAMSARNTELTRTGTVMGSPHYMSPEQVMGERVDTRTDIYSAGVTLYQALTGKPPIDGASDFAIAHAHLHEAPVPPAQLDPHLPPRLSDIVMKALEKSPDQRFQSADEFLKALETFPADETMTYVPARAVPGDLPRRTGSGSDSGSPRAKTGSTLTDAAVLSEISKELAHFIGPIARIIVNRAAVQAQTLDELYSVIGKEIASDADRRRFLATRARYSTRRQD